MRALIVYCHPNENSFNNGILTTIENCLKQAGSEYSTLDIYKDGFDPIIGKSEWENYLTDQPDDALLDRYIDGLKWCDSLIFIYPTWWYGMPAILKGWLDRVLLPGVAFEMPKAHGEKIKPRLKHITRLAVFTTCGASWLLTRFIGAPGRRTILRGVRLLCSTNCRTSFSAHYLMDSSTPQSRDAHLAKVACKMNRFLKG